MRSLLTLLLVVALSFACRESDCGSRHGQGGRDAALKDNLFVIRRSIDDFHADRKHYPAALEDLVPRYLRKIPVDPITGEGTTWILVRNGTEIIDVKSGAPGTSCDGIPYVEL